MSRIGIRVLIGQHIALNKLEPHPDYVGVICTNTNVYQICREAIDNAMFICEEHYGLFKGPPVQLVCPKDLAFMYVPSHLVSLSFKNLPLFIIHPTTSVICISKTKSPANPSY
jgi:pyruvate dehydrogenase kinase 2/3/4